MTKRTALAVLIMMAAGICRGETQTISRSFEMRYVSRDAKANGETDFKGPTEIFDVDRRIEFLRHYADYAARFFNDPNLDTKVVKPADVDTARARLKPQPLPTVRTRIPLTDWTYLGYRKNLEQEDMQAISAWDDLAGVSVRDGTLVVDADTAAFSKPIAELTWRGFLSWKAKSPTNRKKVSFKLGGAAVVGFGANGKFFYVSGGRELAAGEYKPDTFYTFKVEVDFDDHDDRRYNAYINNELKADYVPLARDCEVVGSLGVEGVNGVVIDDVWGVKYDWLGDKRAPYSIDTFVDEDFELCPVPRGFEQAAYDDSAWKPVPYWPYAHGGERYRGQTLYLRTKVKAGDFGRAILHLETIKPSGELYVNGALVKTVGRRPEVLDVTDYLRRNAENVIAVKVDPYAGDKPMWHMNHDKFAGWFAGLMELDLVDDAHIADVFVYATHVGDPAVLHVEADLVADEADMVGSVAIEVTEWFPEERDIPAALVNFPVELLHGQPVTLKKDITIPKPALWTPDSPNLYKVRVVLRDSKAEDVDDLVFTTGLRTVSQEGGVFRLNGKPDMLNGPLIFQYLDPLDKISQWMYRPPLSEIVKQILMAKAQTGNTIRMSVHDTIVCGVNDRRWALAGDQLGIMFMWQTATWVRDESPWAMDFEGLPKYARLLRNQPSIVMWQPANHPKPLDMDYHEKVFTILHAVNPSRMIAPTACFERFKLSKDFKRIGGYPKNDDPTWPSWTHPKLARGEMEQTTGYKYDWSTLRTFPAKRRYMTEEARVAYLDSPTHAWFDFENEESIGMPNWNNFKGKPYWRIYSYEKGYDEGTIGRVLTLDEWREHQAYQAFSAYEAYRKKRWLDFDGLNWCCMRGGPNTATYMKPMIDYLGHAKLSYHAVKMAFQPVLAGSRNVDTAYGPEDEIPVMVLNLGEARTVDVHVTAVGLDGRKLDETIYRNVELQAGRTLTDLPAWKPDLDEEGVCVFEYRVVSG